jgi:hypothetical protein
MAMNTLHTPLNQNSLHRSPLHILDIEKRLETNMFQEYINCTTPLLQRNQTHKMEQMWECYWENSTDD